MATYVPNASDATQPTEDKFVESAAAEFRTLKAKISADKLATDISLLDIKARSLMVQPGEGLLPLPLEAARAERLLAFSAAGQPIATNFTTAEVAAIIAEWQTGEVSSENLVFQQEGTGAVTRSLQEKAREIVSLQDFGGDSSGAVASDTAFANFIAEAQGNIGIIPAGTWKLTAGNFELAAGTSIAVASGAVFDLSAAPSSTAVFNISGTAGAFVPLTASAAKEAVSLSVAAGAEAGFAPGDLIQIVSEDVYDAGWSNSKYGEYRTVSSVASGVINLLGPTRLAYSIAGASAAKIRKITPIENVVIDFNNATVIGSSNSAVFHRAVKVERGRNIEIKGVRARYCNAAAVLVQNSMNVYVSKVAAIDALNASTGYGVNFVSCCENVFLTDSVFSRVRHAATCSAAAGEYGQIRNMVRMNSVCYDTINTGDAWDTHANAEGVVDINLTSYNSSSTGFNYECASFIALNCKSFKSASSGFRASLGTAVEKTRGSLINCETYNATYGYDLRPATAVNSTSVDWIELFNSKAKSCSQTGFIIGNNSSAATPLVTTGAKIIGGEFEGSNQNGTGLVQYDCPEILIKDGAYYTNQVSGSGIQIRGERPAVRDCRVIWTVNGATGSNSSAAVRLSDCIDASVEGLRVTAPLPGSGARAIKTTGTTTNPHIRGVIAPSLTTKYDFTGASGALVEDEWSANVTIAADAVTVPHGGVKCLTVDTEAAAAVDDLATMLNGYVGQIVTLKSFTSARDVVVKDGTGNFQLGADVTLADNTDTLTVVWTGTYWLRMGGFADN